MVRRSQANSDPASQVEHIKSMLDGFLSGIDHGDLRHQVRSLVPAVHGLRDLGSGLLTGEGISSARDRILAYLRMYPKTLIDGDELMIVSGIGEWARRVRELRKEHGWRIFTGATLADEVEDDPEVLKELSALLGLDDVRIRPDQYILMSEEQDREAALRWNQLSTIRRSNASVKAKLLEYLRLNAGHVVTGEELRYLARDRSEWPRRTRELRTEDGWPVVTKVQGRPDLRVGEYLLEEDRQAEVHDRRIPDAVRIDVLKRDGFRCTVCGWSRDDADPDDPRRLLELHHLEEHAKGGENTADNLIVLCNVHHDEVHAGRLDRVGDAWTRLGAD